MKLTDSNWSAVLRSLPRWTSLSVAARRLLLTELTTTGVIPAVRFGAYAVEIIASGIGEFEIAKHRLSLGNESRDLMIVLRAMGRHPLFDAPTEAALVRYLESTFTNAELEPIASGGSIGWRSYFNRHRFAKRIAFAGWPGDLLEADGERACLAWAAERGVTASLWTGIPLARVMGALQQLAKTLLPFPDGAPLTDVLERYPGKDMGALAAAIATGLGTLVVFASLRQSDLEPMIGLWPAAAKELLRPPPAAPEIVSVAEDFTLAIQMEDMTTVLGAIVAAPLRLRASDRAVFARSQADIATRLVAIPEWAVGRFSHPFGSRVDIAARVLDEAGFVAMKHVDGNPHLHATPAGVRWLALSPHDRLDKLLVPMRDSKEVNPARGYDPTRIRPTFFPFTLPLYEAPAGLRLREAVTAAFRQVTTGFVPVEEFLGYAERTGNPFLVQQSASTRRVATNLMHGDGGDPRETFRHLWREMLSQFLMFRLLHLGGASLGRLDSGAHCFRITEVGGYLLRYTDTFSYGVDERAEVVIQPNFEIVFLGIAPATEASIARFAERAGTAPGLVFRITRKAILAAAEAGVTADDVLGELTRVSSRPLPQNVRREVSGWMASVRRATLRAVHIIECADEEAAGRVASLLGAQARRITATHYEVVCGTAAAKQALIRRLRAGGVFIADGDQSSGSPVARVKRKRAARVPDEWDEDETGD